MCGFMISTRRPGEPTVYEAPAVAEAPLSQLLSVEQVARLLDLSPHTIRAWARARKVPHRKLGRRMLFHPVDVIALVTDAHVEPIEWPKRRDKKGAAGTES
jgi:excisionase family DNA binding protein